MIVAIANKAKWQNLCVLLIKMSWSTSVEWRIEGDLYCPDEIVIVAIANKAKWQTLFL